MKYIASFFVTNAFFLLGMIFIEKKFDKLKKLFTYFCYIVSTLLLVLAFEFSIPALRFIFNVLVYILVAKFLFNKNWRESFLLGMTIIVFGVLAEICYAVTASKIINYLPFSEDNPISVLINNLGIGIFLIIFCSIPIFREWYISLQKETAKIGEKQIMIFSLLITVIFNFICLISYFVSIKVMDSFYLIFISAALTIISSLAIFNYLKSNNKYLEIYEKYNVSLQSIKEIELSLENYRVATHENENQLKTIRAMSKNKKINEYITSLLQDKVNDDEKIVNIVHKLPSGGLRGIIYTKLLVMDEKKIPFELVVDKKISFYKFTKISNDTLTDLCKILGVLLDNAIEAVKDYDEKYILIEIYEEENKISIDITNNYVGFIDIEKIDSAGMSTKGKNHGYGLSLVEKLIKKNDSLEHNSEFVENNFIQRIKIKV